MTAEQMMVAGTAAIASGVITHLIAKSLVVHPPAKLVRRNIYNRRVPVVLGIPVAGVSAAALVILGIVRAATGSSAVGSARMLVATAAVIVVMGVAGLLDDLRGDERPRGFSGHLTALKRGKVTGGIVKLAAGGAVGLVAGALLAGEGAFGLFGTPLVDLREAGWAEAWRVIEIGLFVALTANLMNLLDRAPGRAAKAIFLLAAVCMAGARATWGVAAAPLLGAMAGVFALDLKQKGMAGDAGVNAAGGVVGLGLATLGAPLRLPVLILLLALNLASEKWSFSRLIEENRALRRIDEWGRGNRDTDPAR